MGEQSKVELLCVRQLQGQWAPPSPVLLPASHCPGAQNGRCGRPKGERAFLFLNTFMRMGMAMPESVRELPGGAGTKTWSPSPLCIERCFHHSRDTKLFHCRFSSGSAFSSVQRKKHKAHFSPRTITPFSFPPPHQRAQEQDNKIQ